MSSLLKNQSTLLYKTVVSSRPLFKNVFPSSAAFSSSVRLSDTKKSSVPPASKNWLLPCKSTSVKNRPNSGKKPAGIWTNSAFNKIDKTYRGGRLGSGKKNQNVLAKFASNKCSKNVGATEENRPNSGRKCQNVLTKLLSTKFGKVDEDKEDGAYYKCRVVKRDPSGAYTVICEMQHQRKANPSDQVQPSKSTCRPVQTARKICEKSQQEQKMASDKVNELLEANAGDQIQSNKSTCPPVQTAKKVCEKPQRVQKTSDKEKESLEANPREHVQSNKSTCPPVQIAKNTCEKPQQEQKKTSDRENELLKGNPGNQVQSKRSTCRSVQTAKETCEASQQEQKNTSYKDEELLDAKPGDQVQSKKSTCRPVQTAKKICEKPQQEQKKTCDKESKSLNANPGNQVQSKKSPCRPVQTSKKTCEKPQQEQNKTSDKLQSKPKLCVETRSQQQAAERISRNCKEKPKENSESINQEQSCMETQEKISANSECQQLLSPPTEVNTKNLAACEEPQKNDSVGKQENPGGFASAHDIYDILARPSPDNKDDTTSEPSPKQKSKEDRTSCKSSKKKISSKNERLEKELSKLKKIEQVYKESSWAKMTKHATYQEEKSRIERKIVDEPTKGCHEQIQETDKNTCSEPDSMAGSSNGKENDLEKRQNVGSVCDEFENRCKIEASPDYEVVMPRECIKFPFKCPDMTKSKKHEPGTDVVCSNHGLGKDQEEHSEADTSKVLVEGTTTKETEEPKPCITASMSNKLGNDQEMFQEAGTVGGESEERSKVEASPGDEVVMSGKCTKLLSRCPDMAETREHEDSVRVCDDNKIRKDQEMVQAEDNVCDKIGDGSKSDACRGNEVVMTGKCNKLPVGAVDIEKNKKHEAGKDQEILEEEEGVCDVTENQSKIETSPENEVVMPGKCTKPPPSRCTERKKIREKKDTVKVCNGIKIRGGKEMAQVGDSECDKIDNRSKTEASPGSEVSMSRKCNKRPSKAAEIKKIKEPATGKDQEMLNEESVCDETENKSNSGNEVVKARKCIKLPSRCPDLKEMKEKFAKKPEGMLNRSNLQKEVACFCKKLKLKEAGASKKNSEAGDMTKSGCDIADLKKLCARLDQIEEMQRTVCQQPIQVRQEEPKEENGRLDDDVERDQSRADGRKMKIFFDFDIIMPKGFRNIELQCAADEDNKKGESAQDLDDESGSTNSKENHIKEGTNCNRSEKQRKGTDNCGKAEEDLLGGGHYEEQNLEDNDVVLIKGCIRFNLKQEDEVEMEEDQSKSDHQEQCHKPNTENELSRYSGRSRKNRKLCPSGDTKNRKRKLCHCSENFFNSAENNLEHSEKFDEVHDCNPNEESDCEELDGDQAKSGRNKPEASPGCKLIGSKEITNSRLKCSNRKKKQLKMEEECDVA